VGTASLVFGTIILLPGLLFLAGGLAGMFLITDFDLELGSFAALIIGGTMVVISGLLLRKYDRDKKTNKLLDEREGIKTPKVAEARKCPTCNQESHDKIGDHYKCLNPDCEIDTFQA